MRRYVGAIALVLTMSLCASGCMATIAAKRDKTDALAIAVGLPLDVALAAGGAATVEALSGNGFEPRVKAVLIGGLVVAVIDALMLPGVLSKLQ